MAEPTTPSFWARYWEAAQCVAGSGREFARLSRQGLESVGRLVVGRNAAPGRDRGNDVLLPH